MAVLSNREARPLRGLLAGAAAGLFAAWTMNQFQTLWSKAAEKIQNRDRSNQQDEHQQQAQSSEDSEDATMKAAGKLATILLGRELTHEEKEKAGPFVHYAFGAFSGAIYGLISEYVPAARLGFGTAFGSALFLVADELSVPALGLSRSPDQYPLSSHLYGLASHFVYGLSTEAVRSGIRRIA
jgi:putative membrane protein